MIQHTYKFRTLTKLKEKIIKEMGKIDGGIIAIVMIDEHIFLTKIRKLHSEG